MDKNTDSNNNQNYNQGLPQGYNQNYNQGPPQEYNQNQNQCPPQGYNQIKDISMEHKTLERKETPMVDEQQPQESYKNLETNFKDLNKIFDFFEPQKNNAPDNNIQQTQEIDNEIGEKRPKNYKISEDILVDEPQREVFVHRDTVLAYAEMQEDVESFDTISEQEENSINENNIQANCKHTDQTGVKSLQKKDTVQDYDNMQGGMSSEEVISDRSSENITENQTKNSSLVDNLRSQEESPKKELDTEVIDAQSCQKKYEKRPF